MPADGKFDRDNFRLLPGELGLCHRSSLHPAIKAQGYDWLATILQVRVFLALIGVRQETQLWRSRGNMFAYGVVLWESDAM